MSAYGPLLVMVIIGFVVFVCWRHDLAERNKSCDKTPAKRRPRRAF